MRTIPRREGVADAVRVYVDLGLARDAFKVVEADLTRAGVTADASVVVAPGAVFAMKAVGVVEAGVFFAAAEDEIAAVAADAITADDDVVVVVMADPIFAAAEDASAAVAAAAISTAGEGAADVVDADAGVRSGAISSARDPGYTKFGTSSKLIDLFIYGRFHGL